MCLIFKKEAYIGVVLFCTGALFCTGVHLLHMALDPVVYQAGNIGPRRYEREYIRRFIQEAKNAGYLVTYNHPNWSMEEPEEILHYDGFFSLEIFNTGSMVINGHENNLGLYDRLLRHGKFPYVHGADDNHNKQPFGDPRCDSFGAWTMIMARELSYPAIIEALEKGDFYASTGPSIHELRFEGSQVYLACSEARRIMMHMSPKRSQNVCARPGETVLLSQSYGRKNNSALLRYDLDLNQPDGSVPVGGSQVPAYILDSRVLREEITAMPMTEALATGPEGNVLVLFESGAMAYKDGKFRTDHVWSLKLSQ